MTPSTAPRRRHLASSPFAPRPEPVIESFDVDDRVTHDSHGLGKVIGIEPAAVSVDFGSHVLRIVTPYDKLHHL